MKKIVTNEMIDIINNDIKLTKDIHIDEYEFLTNQSISVGLVTINIHPNGCYLNLSSDVDKHYMLNWVEDIGEIVVNDFKHKTDAKYFEFRTQLAVPEYKALLRRVRDDEYEEFKEKEFIHFKIGDFYYTLIKLVPANKGYNSKDSIHYIPVETTVEEVEEEYDKSVEEDVHSLSLFDE